MAKVEIYTKAYCPYCSHAIALLKQKSVSFDEIKIDDNPSLRSVMIERSQGAYTVPQIFIGDKHIGGCDDLVALDAKQQLDTLLTTP
ncbi:glutaredoxin 3 [Colwellia sp. D2M02]|uniref:glutaredoxin 3 n=1 Tax=Colwellia sp. D2M02 TaxID=2841562 RepID=UPI001C097A03|nr:glutaredoxin 3 [Colwellia sp. D2M02]MBU2893572.1 glutaredoxin 3 [Colwellia sp. D2M02]